MNREDLRGIIREMKVFDTHTHLVGNSLAAKDFWEIAHYFWFLQELQAAGYPKELEKLSEDERIDAFCRAFEATRNTSMNWVVRNIFKDLYGIELSGPKAVREAIEMVKATASQPDWPQEVSHRLSIEKMVVNHEEHVDFQCLPNRAVWVPRIDDFLSRWVNNIEKSEDQRAAAVEVEQQIKKLFSEYRKKGCPGIMTTLPRFNAKTYGTANELHKQGNTRDDIVVYLLNIIGREATNNKFFVQFFLGMEDGWSSTRIPANDPERIIKLYGLFERYDCDYELVVASEINNLDVVQAAHILTNVYVGGLWWYNFRASTYMDCMQKRFEALPPCKSSLVVSDARCIEW